MHIILLFDLLKQQISELSHSAMKEALNFKWPCFSGVGSSFFFFIFTAQYPTLVCRRSFFFNLLFRIPTVMESQAISGNL